MSEPEQNSVRDLIADRGESASLASSRDGASAPEPLPVQRGPELPSQTLLERDAWTRFAAAASQRREVENEREAAIWADLLLDEWRVRWGRP